MAAKPADAVDPEGKNPGLKSDRGQHYADILAALYASHHRVLGKPEQPEKQGVAVIADPDGDRLSEVLEAVSGANIPHAAE